MAMMQVEHDRATDSTPTPAEQLRLRAAAWSEARQRLRGAAVLSDIATGRNPSPGDDPEPHSADCGPETANDVMRSIRLASHELHARRTDAAARSVELDTRELELGQRARELVDFCAVLTRRGEGLEQDARDLRDRHEQLQTLEASLNTRLAELAAGEGELVEREEACLTVERAVARQQVSLESREDRLATRRSAAGEAWLRIRAERAAVQRSATNG